MSDMPSHHKIAIASIKCFSDDGKLDIGEINFLLGIALADGIVSDDEKRILGSVFSRIGIEGRDAVLVERIRQAKKMYGI